MTAEQFEKWENWALRMSHIVWDREMSSDEPRPKKEWEAGFLGGFCFGAEESREAYKSALRKAIEMRQVQLSKDKYIDQVDRASRIKELNNMKKLLDTVTPE